LNEEEKRKFEIFTQADFGDGDQYVKDRLFVECGEDVEDIFIAFKFYKCDAQKWFTSNIIETNFWIHKRF